MRISHGPARQFLAVLVTLAASLPLGAGAAAAQTAPPGTPEAPAEQAVAALTVASADAAPDAADQAGDEALTPAALARVKISHDGRIASIPMDPDNVEAIKDLIQSARSENSGVNLSLYEPVGLLPHLLVTGQPENVASFVKTVSEIFLDTGSKHLVVISARLTQLTDSEIRDLGLNLFPSSLTYDASWSKTMGKALTGSGSVKTSSGNVLVADESLGKGKALVASEVFTPNGVKAEISDVQHEPVFSVDSNQNVQTNYQDLETNIQVTPMVMQFDPQAPEASSVRLDITVKVSLISGEKRLNDVTAPQYSDKSFQTTRVFPGDGRTYLVGSFVSDTDIQSRSGVPFLSEIPLIKYLFSKKTTSRSRSYALLTLAVNVRPSTLGRDQLRLGNRLGVGEPSPAPRGAKPAKPADTGDVTKLLDQLMQPLRLDDWIEAP